MQQRNPIRSGEKIKGEVSAGANGGSRGSFPPAEPAPRPARPVQGAAQLAESGPCSGQPNARSWVPVRSSLPTPGLRPASILSSDAVVPYREPGALAARAGAARLPGTWCWWRPRLGSEPRRERGGLGGVWARGTERGPARERERGRRRRQLLTESAPRPAPGVGAGDRRAGLGAGAREEQLTVKSQAKAQKTQERELSLPFRGQLRERTARLVWVHCRHPSALRTPSQARHPHPL